MSNDSSYRSVKISPHRLTPLREKWKEIYTPIVEYLKLQIRFDPRRSIVELRTSELTEDPLYLNKAADYLHAFNLGFELEDAIALIRLDNIFIETFDILEVKQTLKGDNLSRAIGRIAGRNGKTKFAIENATMTRIVLADRKVHILGSFNNIKYARDVVCDLILGTTPGKAFEKLKVISQRLREI